MATGNENPGAMAQTYQFILNLVPAIVSIFVSGQIIRYVFKWLQLKHDSRINNMIDTRVNPKLEELEGKIDLLIKMQKNG